MGDHNRERVGGREEGREEINLIPARINQYSPSTENITL